MFRHPDGLAGNINGIEESAYIERFVTDEETLDIEQSEFYIEKSEE